MFKNKFNRSAKVHQVLFFLFFDVEYGIFISNNFRGGRYYTVKVNEFLLPYCCLIFHLVRYYIKFGCGLRHSKKNWAKFQSQYCQKKANTVEQMHENHELWHSLSDFGRIRAKICLKLDKLMKFTFPCESQSNPPLRGKYS